MKKEPVLDSKGYRKFGMRDKAAYALGDLGCNMSFSLKNTVQTFWLVFMMLETGLLSALLIVVQIWDAVNDPLIGALIDSDRRKYKMGKFKTYIFIGACGLLVGGAMVFLPFPNAHVVLKAILFIVGYIIWDAFYTIANVPYGSMLSLVTEDDGERAQLSTWRSVGSMIGNIVPMVLLPMLIWRKVTEVEFADLVEKGKVLLPEGVKMEDFIFEDGFVKNPQTNENIEVLLGENVFWTALIMGVLGFLAFILMIKLITVRVDENTVKTNESAGGKLNIFKAFVKFMKNRPAVGATLAAVGMFLGMQSATTANTIMFATYFGMASLSGIVQLIGFIPMFAFMPFITKIVKKFGKKEASVVGSLVSIFGGLIMLIFPLIPNKTASLIVYLVGLVFFGFGLGVYTCVSWAMMGDAIDYNEWKFGTREEGTVYSLHSFFRKLAQGVGPAAVLLVMGWIGYKASNGIIQDESVAYGMCWLVAGLYLFSAILQFVGLAFIYNLDKKTLNKMTTELAERKAAAQETEGE